MIINPAIDAKRCRAGQAAWMQLRQVSGLRLRNVEDQDQQKGSSRLSASITNPKAQTLSGKEGPK